MDITVKDMQRFVQGHAEVKQGMIGAYHRRGGDKVFDDWINASPANEEAYYKTILPKLLPKEVDINTNSDVESMWELARRYNAGEIDLPAIEVQVTQEAPVLWPAVFDSEPR